MGKITTLKRIILALAILLLGISIVGVSSCGISKHTEASSLIEQRVRQYNKSSRVIKMEGIGDVIIYTVAVKRDSGKAKDLILKR
jgi:hypothetical protein